ncbi:hypothetical protein J3Z87_003753 [Escherichia coli]|nr:hypothetical protein [Escherichia coli]
MKRLILLSVMVATLPPYAISAEDISPESLSGKPSSELGDFVYSAMPDAGHGLSWDWQSNSDIVWADGVTQTASGMSLRTGFARINVMGVKSTVLEKRKKELGWEVSLGTSMPAKFGPEYISMAPSKCGGYLNENCTFNPASSLTKRGIEFHKICLTWFYLIGTDNPIWYSIIQSYVFISFDTAKIIITVICIVWVVRSITDYELKTVLFTQADIQKEILKELRALRNSKEMHNADTAGDDFRIDFDKVDY